MKAEHLIFLSVPGLRARDIDRANTPALYELANRGALAELTPTFPCVTSCVQASMWTGRPPADHGVVANGFYHRDRGQVEFWVGRNGVIGGPQIWEELHRRGRSAAVWHAQNIKDAAADFIVTPAPIHAADGTMKLWCYSKPDGLYQRMLDAGLEHFPLQHYWGPLANIQSTRWILKAALWLIGEHAPHFHWIYLPHLDYAGQKFGPNGPQAAAALGELDTELAGFFADVARTPIGRSTAYIVAGEYAMTEVTGVVYPNQVLRRAGLPAIEERDGREYLDPAASAAFALVDHQFAHVYLKPPRAGARQASVEGVAALFQEEPGVAGVFAGKDRSRIGMDHERCGEIVLVADGAHWFAYYWWLDDALAPPFARTVDIHSKPGYDPVELFFDPATRGIPLDAGLVKGSHGVPATGPQHRTALIASPPLTLPPVCRDTDLFRLCLNAME